MAQGDMANGKRDAEGTKEVAVATTDRAPYEGRHFKTAASEPQAKLGGEDAPSEQAAPEKAEQQVEQKTVEPPATIRDGEHRHHHHRHRSKARRRVLIALSVVLVLLAVAAGGAFAWWRSSVEAGRQALTQQTRKKADEGTVEYNGKKYRLNENVVSVCFLGYDNRGDQASGKGGQCDSIIVLAFDTKAGTVKGISIPRDSMVTVDAYSGDSYAGQTTEQICLQYSYGDGGHRSSELTANTVSRVLYGVPITYYFTLNIEGIAPLNDAAGGVTITPQVSMPKYGIYAGQALKLSGKQARAYVHDRDDSATGSVDRAGRQVQYIQAFASQVFEQAKQNPAVLMDLFNQAQQYVFTNLGVEEFSYLADQALSHGVSSFDIQSLQGEATMGQTFTEFHLNSDSVRQAVMDTFYTPVE